MSKIQELRVSKKDLEKLLVKENIKDTTYKELRIIHKALMYELVNRGVHVSSKEIVAKYAHDLLHNF